MSGKKKPEKKTADKKSTPPATKPQSGKTTLGSPSGFAANKNSWLLLAVVLLVTGIVFSGVTKLQWTNWDDDEYVYENPMVINGDYKGIFTKPVNNNYNPLPVAMQAWEWSLVTNKSVNGKIVRDRPLEEKAFIFHVNNLWMHLVCTGLVFWLMLLLGLNPLWAGLAALMFGIHPLRVESVAWITERKDVMFGMFYVAAMVAYMKYLESKKMLLYAICMVLFVLSLLSKIQAVSLPLSLLAIDWYRGRKFDIKLLVEKVPFFVGSLVIGIIGWRFLKEGGTIDTDQTFGFAQRIALGLTSFCIYIFKALIPYQTSTYYPYPKEVGGLYYLGMFGALGFAAIAVLMRNIAKEVTFGLVFFAFNIVFLLQIVGAGSAYLADRFTYIAYIGLFFMFAMLAQRASAAMKSIMPVVAAVSVLMVGGFAFLTIKYIPAWHDTDTLFSDVINKFPKKVVLPYVNRGQYLRRQGQKLMREGKQAEGQKQINRALADFEMGIQLQPNYHLSYLNRGNIYFDRGENEKAIADYTKVMEILGPVNPKPQDRSVVASAYSNRGAIYSRKGMSKEALADLDMALKFNDKDVNTWSNRALTYFDLGDYPKAIADITKVLEFKPDDDGSMNQRGVSYMRLGKWKESMTDFNMAISLEPKNGAYYSNRAIAQANLGNKAAALADAQQAQAFGQQMDPGFLQSLQQ